LQTCCFIVEEHLQRGSMQEVLQSFAGRSRCTRMGGICRCGCGCLLIFSLRSSAIDCVSSFFAAPNKSSQSIHAGFICHRMKTTLFLHLIPHWSTPRAKLAGYKAYPLLGIAGSEINQQTDLKIENQMYRKWPRVGTYE
jgi:hypothetical protein